MGDSTYKYPFYNLIEDINKFSNQIKEIVDSKRSNKRNWGYYNLEGNHIDVDFLDLEKPYVNNDKIAQNMIIDKDNEVCFKRRMVIRGTNERSNIHKNITINNEYEGSTCYKFIPLSFRIDSTNCLMNH